MQYRAAMEKLNIPENTNSTSSSLVGDWEASVKIDLK
jgi:hypothetical protein